MESRVGLVRSGFARATRTANYSVSLDVIKELQTTIKELKQEIERLRVSRDLDSKTSSKPPSTDLLKKPELKLSETEPETPSPKRKPGFGRVDRFEILRPWVLNPLDSWRSVLVRCHTELRFLTRQLSGDDHSNSTGRRKCNTSTSSYFWLTIG